MSDATSPWFQFFNEIGIIAQLGRARFESHMPDGVLLTHFTVLNHLVRVQDGVTPLRLARAFQTPKTSMTHTLAGLESRGWIEMRPNPEDGRSKCVFLTQAGRRFRDDAIGALSADLSELGDALGDDWLDAALGRLRAVRQHLDAARDG